MGSGRAERTVATTTGAVPSSITKPRHEVLAPFHAQLAALLQQHGNRTGPLEIQVRKRQMTLTPWQKGALAAALAGGRPPASGLARIVADGIALQAKALSDLDRFERSPLPTAEERDRQLAELLYDAALGLALNAEIRRAVEALRKEGRSGLAGNLTRIAGSVAALIKQIEPHLGAEATQVARRLAAELEIDHPAGIDGDLAIPAAAGPASVPGGAAPRRVAGAGRAARSFAVRQIAVAFAAVAGVAAVAVGAFVFLSGPPDVPLDRAARMPGVLSLAGDPPAAVVTLDPSRWDQLSDAKRTGLVFGIASVLKRNGYREIEFRLPDGGTVARWESGRPVELASARD
ncbi:MAG: hypothetical protein D6718_01025 [Acidobacteria bacterium]|nr:MAG: hypothetical protein D6718_01025 [Acidobacteriota bacterium]